MNNQLSKRDEWYNPHYAKELKTQELILARRKKVEAVLDDHTLTAKQKFDKIRKIITGKTDQKQELAA